MENTTTDYFIKRVETQREKEKEDRRTIIRNAVMGTISIASAAYILATEDYPFDSIILERLCPVLGVAGAMICHNEITKILQANNTFQRETKTPAEKARVYTKNLQREISFK